MGKIRAALCPCRRRASSATNAGVIGGAERAMSATVKTTLLASRSAISIKRSAQSSARLRSSRLAMTRDATRRRFSISARRSMIGMAHSSPRVSGVMVWYEAMKQSRLGASTRPSPWAMVSRAMS
ncbi:hypothetical protein D3C81_1410660 [compost metagenome]